MKNKNTNWSLLTVAVTGLLALMLAGCGTTPLKGGKATTVNKPAQGIEQTVVQSDNPAQVSRQDQETVKTRSYTVPAGSRLEDARVTANAARSEEPHV